MQPTTLSLEVSESTVRRLIQQGLLTIDDFRCQNRQTKAFIKHLYLEATKDSLKLSHAEKSERNVMPLT